MNDDRFAARIGQTIAGKWQLERLIGVGGMAAVYAARHRVGAPVAIKILHPEVARDSDLRQRFEREAMVMGRLEHPGAVDVRDIDVTEEGAPYIVMELLEGESLKERAQRLGGVPPADLLAYVDQALDVLAAAHEQGVVHRDIKPDNLFITHDGTLKVLDFGIARMREGAPMTMVGTRLGTLPYMPPEQVRAVNVDHRADIFALGAVMFRILARRRIHETKTESEMLIKMSSEPAPALKSVAPQLPVGLCAVVDCALAFDKEERYVDARAMQVDVRALRQGQPPQNARPPSRFGVAAGSGPHTARPSQPTRVESTGPVVGDEPTRTGGTAPIGSIADRAPAEATRATNISTGAMPPAALAAGPASGTAAATPFSAGPARAAVSAFGETLRADAAGTHMPVIGVPAPMHAAPTQVAPTQGGVGDPTQVSAGVTPPAAYAHASNGSYPQGYLAAVEAQGAASTAMPPPATMSVNEPGRKKPVVAILLAVAALTVAGGLAFALSGRSALDTAESEPRRAAEDDEGDRSSDERSGDEIAGRGEDEIGGVVGSQPPPASTTRRPAPSLADRATPPDDKAELVAKDEPPTARPPGAEPPTARPPGAEPPTARPPGAEPPTARPPGAEPPTARPPGAEPPTARPPGAEPPASKPASPPVDDPPDHPSGGDDDEEEKERDKAEKEREKAEKEREKADKKKGKKHDDDDDDD